MRQYGERVETLTGKFIFQVISGKVTTSVGFQLTRYGQNVPDMNIPALNPRAIGIDVVCPPSLSSTSLAKACVVIVILEAFVVYDCFFNCNSHRDQLTSCEGENSVS